MADGDDAGRSARLLDYKNKGKDEDYMRTKRRDYNVELRKQSRADQLMKKRQLDDDPEALSIQQANELLEKTQQQLANSNDPFDKELSVIIRGILNDAEPAFQYECTRLCRKMVSRAVSPPIKAVVNTGIVPKIVQMLSWDDKPNIQFEAAWVLTNIASGSSDETAIVYNAGALPHLLRLLNSANSDVREQAVWALGNIVGDGSALRDKVLEAGGLELVMAILQRPDSSLNVIRNGTWTLSNFCRGKDPRPDFAHVSKCLPMLLDLIAYNDEPTRVDAVWAVAYISDNTQENLDYILSTRVHFLLAELLRVTQSPDLILPILRALGNITTGSNDQTQEIVNLRIVELFPTIMNNQPDNIRKEAAWVISNIAAGTPDQIQYLIGCNILPALIRAGEGGDFRVRKEVSWALVNMVFRGTVEQCTVVVDAGALPMLVSMLHLGSSDRHILDGLSAILLAGTKNGRLQEYINIIDAKQGVEKLENLCNNASDTISKQASQILDTYFAADDDVVPMHDPNSFAFGADIPHGGYRL
eukprot:m.114954 g.114954  ORF g.114954 m.114954 type:complete len:530 (+) comp16042_c0_seq1:257-1846(+)